MEQTSQSCFHSIVNQRIHRFLLAAEWGTIKLKLLRPTPKSTSTSTNTSNKVYGVFESTESIAAAILLVIGNSITKNCSDCTGCFGAQKGRVFLFYAGTPEQFADRDPGTCDVFVVRS